MHILVSVVIIVSVMAYSKDAFKILKTGIMLNFIPHKINT